MTTSVGSFLLGPDSSIEEVLAGREAGGLRHALRGVSAQRVQAVVDADLRSVAAGLLALDLGDIALSAWRRHAAFAAAARATAADPALEQVVDLATHRITSTHRPYVDVRVDGALVARVQFELSLVFVVTAFVAVVRQRRIVALRSGRCDLTGALSVDGAELVARQASLDLASVVRPGDGLVL